MYRDTAGNAVTYEAANKPEDTSKSGQKRVFFPSDKDRSRSDSYKRPKDDARKDGQDGRKYGGQSSIVYLSAVICKCDMPIEMPYVENAEYVPREDVMASTMIVIARL